MKSILSGPQSKAQNQLSTNVHKDFDTLSVIMRQLAILFVHQLLTLTCMYIITATFKMRDNINEAPDMGPTKNNVQSVITNLNIMKSG